MNYSLRDYLIDISYNYDLDDSHAEHQLHPSQLPIRNGVSRKSRCLLEYDLLELNKILYVSSDHYKLHKSYPSPRSLHPLHIYIVNKTELVTMDAFTGEVHCCHPVPFSEENTLFIYYEDKYPHFYKSIKKSLLLLETGHVLYNIKAVLELHDERIEEICLTEGGLRLTYTSEKKHHPKPQNRESLKERFSKRSSGSYRVNDHSLYAPIAYKKHALNRTDLLNGNVLFKGFQQQLSKLMICQYVNDGNGVFELSDPHSYKEELCPALSYIQLNTMMSYLNFRGKSSIIVFFVNNHTVSEGDMKDLLLTMGMLAQHYSISLSPHYRTRPIKSVGTAQLPEKIGLDPGAYTAFYGLVIY